MPEPRPSTPAVTLFIIRAAILVGVLTFASVTWYLHSQGGRATTGGPQLDRAVLGVWGLATLAIVFFGTRYRAARTRAERATLAIIGWAAGEGAALAGTVHYFLTGDPRRFPIGMLILAAALLLFPIPPDEPAAR